MPPPLEEFGERLWIAEGEIVSFLGVPYPTRSVVVKLDDGGLWVWSPVKLTPALRAAVDRLGKVAHLVSPNKLHHLYLKDWHAAYPAAALWGPASTMRRHSGLPFGAALNDVAPASWQGAIDQAWFRGSFAMDEIVFFHAASRTVIVADLIQAFDDNFLDAHWRWWQRWLARADGIVAARPLAPLEWRLSFLNRAPARAARDKALAWNCERVVMAHGALQQAGGAAFLRRSFGWLG